jgi:peptidyl-prolyl cis-trans isomerase SurA
LVGLLDGNLGAGVADEYKTCEGVSVLAMQGGDLKRWSDWKLWNNRHGGRRQVPAGALLLLGAALLVSGCGHTHSADVVAKVNGKPIYAKDVQAVYENSLGENQQKPSVEQEDIVRLNIVRQLIDEEILAQRAAKLNLAATDEEVDSQINEMKAPFTQEEFDKRMAEKHLTLVDLRHDIRRAKTTEKLLNKEVNSKINITDEDISSYYNAHKAEYDLVEPEYHLARIVVTSQPAPATQSGGVGNLQNSKASNDDEAKKKIEMLHNRLESGEDFGTLAANFSEQPDNASSGGDLGFFQESQVKSDPTVYDAVSKLKPGQISEVLPLLDPTTHKQIGYAIYRLLDREAAGQRDLSDPRVQQSIRQQLRDTRSQLLKNAFLEVLRDQAKVENYFAEDIFKNGAQPAH